MIVQLTKVRLLLSLFAAALVSVLGLSVSRAAQLSSPTLTHPGQPLLAPVTTTTPTATPTPAPVRIHFAPGATSAVVEGEVSFPQRNQYIYVRNQGHVWSAAVFRRF